MKIRPLLAPAVLALPLAIGCNNGDMDTKGPSAGSGTAGDTPTKNDNGAPGAANDNIKPGPGGSSESAPK